ncbi:helix-turn-helix domain-containing protein [Algibacillus agarilyticus]|uniref:helix-turn-helix domain-containing protein n=1 Tax=Algibacillus agarilyticus TaxID=2234133 RepID=UPI000DCF8BDA|nr:helix-turn-helix transcriptional regulator [Algibacillus agarilyticus]
MSQISQVTSTLKQLLRQQQITYKAVASHLMMSEANVKRIFSSQSFTLDKLEAIAELVGMSLTELFILVDEQRTQLSQLTHEQEKELVADPQLLLVAVCVRDGWTFSDIIKHYDLDEFACTRLLAKLDRLNIIELQVNNRYKVLIAQDFKWIPHGPLERFITQDVIQHFLLSNFSDEQSYRFYLRGSYSEQSLYLLKRKLQQLTYEAGQLNEQDSHLPLNQRQHFGLLTAMRPWELSLFQNMRRK